MRTFECPSCGAAVNFSSGAAIFAVCESCRSMVIRNDIKLEAIGAMAALPPDLSPLQIGTTGECAGQRFTLRGRVRLAWSQGSWSEWYAEFGDGRRGWLAETQGFFAISFLDEEVVPPSQLGALHAGETIRFSNRVWTIADYKDTTCVAAEGELPFVARPGARRASVDLVGPEGEFGSFEDHHAEDGKNLFYEGAYAEFDDLKFENLRPVPGWFDRPHEPERDKTHTLNCPNCAAPVALRAEGLTMSVACGSCGTVIDTARPEVQILQHASQTIREMNPVLPLGRRGEIGGTTYEIIGLVIREDAYVKWSEYLLFNPWKGFSWLVTYNGHWSFVRRLLTPPACSHGAAFFKGESHALYAEGNTRVRAVLGEFYWQITRGEESKLGDFIAPPHILSQESYPGLSEQTWSFGEYVEASVITSAFAIDPPLARPIGIYLNQPNPYDARRRFVCLWAVVGLIGLVAIQTFFATRNTPQQVFSGNFTYARAAVEQNEITTPVFKLDGDSAPLEIETSAPVSNTWLDLDLELVNASTGATLPAGVGVSYYFGSDSDGAWSEGSQRESTSLPAVPAGDYFLRIDPSADATISGLPFTLRVTRGGVFWSNFFLCAGFLLAYPAWVLWRRHAFERARWSESDFSPYSTGGDDDE